MAGDALRELLISFGIGVDTSELKKGEKESEGFIGKLKTFAKVAAEAFAIHEVKEFIEGQIEAGAQLKVTADRLGTTTNELQALRLAAGEAGVSVEAMDTGLRFLNRNIAKAAHGGGQAAVFRKLGISLKEASGEARPAGDVMGDLADHIAALKDPAEKTNIAMELLGRGGAQLIPLLNKGGAAFEEARKDMEALGGGMSEDFVEAAHKAEVAQTRLKFATTGLSSTITLAVIPDVMKLVEGFTSLVKGASEVEKKAHIVEDALGFLKTGVVVGGIYKIVTGVRALTSAQIAAAATNPFVLLAVGAAAALLTYNDLKVALEGGKSVFGDYFGQTGIESLKDFIDDANDGLDEMQEVLETIYNMLALVLNSFKWMGQYLAAGASGAARALAAAVTPGASVQHELDQGAAQMGAADQATGSDVQRNLANLGKGWGEGLGGSLGDGSLGRSGRRHAREGASFSAEYARDPLASPTAQLFNPDAQFNAVTGQYDNPYLQRNDARLPSSGGGGAPAAAGSTVIHQNNPVTIELHPAATDGPGTARAVKSALATPEQSSLSNALTAKRKP